MHLLKTKKQKNRLAIIVLSIALIATGVTILCYSLNEYIVLYYTPSEFYKKIGYKHHNKTFKIGGIVKEGSIVYNYATPSSMQSTQLNNMAKATIVNNNFSTINVNCTETKNLSTLSTENTVITAKSTTESQESADTIKVAENNSATTERPLHFIIRDIESEIKVFFTGISPSLFGENNGVIAEGIFDENLNLHATILLAKHDETYMARYDMKQ